jgi:hypothetical protein
VRKLYWPIAIVDFAQLFRDRRGLRDHHSEKIARRFHGKRSPKLGEASKRWNAAPRAMLRIAALPR